MLRANRPATPQGGAPAPMQQAPMQQAPMQQAPAQPQQYAPPAQQPQQYAPPQYQEPAPQQYQEPAPQQYQEPAPQQYAPPAQQPPQQYAPPQYAPPQYAPPQQQQPPAQPPQYTPAPAPQYGTNLPAIPGGSIASMNQGVLENMDNMGSIGNYVTIDGSEFLYKSSNRRATYIDVNVHYGKRYYQWVDESNPAAKEYHNADTKLDDRYKLKGEIRWLEPSEDPTEEPTEFIHSLSTTSMIQFADYLKKLASAGMGVGQVWTRLTISRHEAQGGKKERYSRADFAAFRLEDGAPLNIVSNA